MYRYSNGQISLADFKQPVGMNLKESNRWVKKAQTIPWLTESGYPARHWGVPGRVRPETGLRITGMSVSVWKWSADSAWRSENAAWDWLLPSCKKPLPM